LLPNNPRGSWRVTRLVRQGEETTPWVQNRKSWLGSRGPGGPNGQCGNAAVPGVAHGRRGPVRKGRPHAVGHGAGSGRRDDSRCGWRFGAEALTRVIHETRHKQWTSVVHRRSNHDKANLRGVSIPKKAEATLWPPDGVRGSGARRSYRPAARQSDVVVSLAQRDPTPGDTGPLHCPGPDRHGRLPQAA